MFVCVEGTRSWKLESIEIRGGMMVRDEEGWGCHDSDVFGTQILGVLLRVEVDHIILNFESF